MKVSSSLIAATVAALLPFAGAVAQSPTPDQPTQQPSQPAQESQGATFESLDQNGDGRISKSEAAVSANVTAQFAKYDQNGDGFIEKAEVTSSNAPPPATSPEEPKQ